MQQISKIQKICQDKGLGGHFFCGLDGIVQLRRETWRSEPNVRQKRANAHQPRLLAEVGLRDKVVEEGRDEAGSPVAPHHRVGLFVGMPGAQTNTQPGTDAAANSGRVIDKLQQHDTHQY